MAIEFGSIITNFQEWGVFDYFLPFLLAFALIFAILEKVHILGSDANQKPKTNLNILVALIFALFLIAQPTVVAMIQGLLPATAFVIVVILAIIIVMAAFGGYAKDGSVLGSPIFWILLAITLIVLLWVYVPELSSFGVSVPSSWTLSDSAKSMLLALVCTVLIIFFILKSKKSGGGNSSPKP